MDISLWYKLNKKLRVTETAQLFYGRFSHKIVLNIPFAYHISVSKNSIELLHVLTRRLHTSAANIPMVADRLEPLASWYFQRDKTKFGCRIERNSVSIFCQDLESLYDLMTGCLSKYSLVSLSTVFSDETQKLLDSGCVIVKRNTDYNFKVRFREGFYKNVEDRNNLGKYLRNLGDEIQATNHMLNMLESSNKYIGGSYVYIKDIRIVDMINLIVPGIVRSVQSVVTK